MSAAGKGKRRRDTLAALQRCISAMESGGTAAPDRQHVPGLVPLGAEPLDAALRGGLARAALHEIRPGAYGDIPAAAGFGLALTARLMAARRGPVLWCRRRHDGPDFGRPYGPGLAALGVPPERLVIVTIRTDRQMLQAMEEGLRARALAAVLGGAEKVDLTASRRLSLASAEGRTPCLLLRPHTAEITSAARTRWCIAARPGAPDTLDANAPGRPRWQVTLERCRNGRPGAWIVDWDHETHRFHLAAPLADRPAAPRGKPGDVVPLRRAG